MVDDIGTLTVDSFGIFILKRDIIYLEFSKFQINSLIILGILKRKPNLTTILTKIIYIRIENFINFQTLRVRNFIEDCKLKRILKSTFTINTFQISF